MSIENVRSSLNALENLARNLGLDTQDFTQRRDPLQEQDGQQIGQEADSVSLTSSTLRRLQMTLGSEEPISQEEAAQAVQHVRLASSEQLLQAHGGLDPQRVFALLGSDD